MNNIFKIILVFLIFSNCSFSKNSKFWNQEKLDKETILKTESINQKENLLDLEINPSLKINLYSKVVSRSFINTNSNNDGRINFEGKFTN
ncbi:hypothetical protein N9K55_03260, partial [Candidatus Pelagibacter bacterium]|nr:hypothetical protein [Candidatus Pelagibacter bacterium]